MNGLLHTTGPSLTALAESTDGGGSWAKPLLHRYSINNSVTVPDRAAGLSQSDNSAIPLVRRAHSPTLDADANGKWSGWTSRS